MNTTIRSVPLWTTCAALVFFASTPVVSQTLKVGGGLGIASPASDLSGSTLEFYEGSRYGVASTLNFQGKAKVGLPGFGLTGEVDYASFGNTGNSEPGQGSVDVSMKVISLKIGSEFHFAVPGLPMTPYLGANVAMNRISGETKFAGVSRVASATYSVEAATRFGVGFSAGAEVGIGPLLQLDFNISYNMLNLFGREWKDVNPTVDQRIDSYLALNDSSDPAYAAGDDKHVISSDRDLHSVQFTVSVLFGL